jgi:hypothetical protein
VGARLAGQGFFAKTMTRATGRDGGGAGRARAEGFLEVAYNNFNKILYR